MNLTAKHETLMRRYLLGEVTDHEREQVEEQLMTNSQYLDHLFRTEERLIDEYVKGEMSGDEREPFETYFLSAPERQDKLAFAESLNRYITEARALKSAEVIGSAGEVVVPREAIFRLGQTTRRAATALLAVATLVLVVVTIILIADNARLKKQILEQRANIRQAEERLQQQLDEQTGRNDELARQLEQSQNEMSAIDQELARLKQEKNRQIPDPPAKIGRGGIDDFPAVSLIIAPGSVRDTGQANRAYLTNDLKRLNLGLKLQGEEYRAYQAEVKTLEGKSIWRQSNLRAQQQADEKTLFITLPTSRLPEGDYLVTLNAVAPGGGYEEVATYYFTVLRE